MSVVAGLVLQGLLSLSVWWFLLSLGAHVVALESAQKRHRGRFGELGVIRHSTWFSFDPTSADDLGGESSH